MEPIVGIKYEQTVEELRKRIRRNQITILEEIAINHSCYFCGEAIIGKMFVLEDRAKNKTSLYFIDDSCYTQAKNCVFYNSLIFSLN